MIDDVVLLVRQGGWVMGPIVLASVAAWSLIVYEWLALRPAAGREAMAVDRAVARLERGESVQLDERAATHGNVALAVLSSGIVALRPDRDTFEARVGPLLKSETTLRQRPLRLVAMLSVVMPLLGLLGTVLGMTQTFGAFTTRGAPQIDALADGISQALITTQAGLVAAVPVLLVHGVLRSRVRRYLGKAEVTIKRIEALACRDDS